MAKAPKAPKVQPRKNVLVVLTAGQIDALITGTQTPVLDRAVDRLRRAYTDAGKS